MKLPRNAKIFRGQLDVAPFAGVTFLVLIFFLLSSKLVFTPGVRIDLDLPEVSYRVPGTTNLSVVVAVDIGGQFYYDGQAITEEQLFQALKGRVAESSEPLTLEIRADKSGRLETAFRLMSMAGEIGFAEAQVVSRPPIAPLRPATADRDAPK